MTTFERMARLGDRLFDRLRDKRAFDVDDSDAVDGDFESLRGQTYAVMVTFRRNGEAMPSPVWFALDHDGRAYVKTRHDAGKVKRLRNDPRVLMAASNSRGRPTGPVVRATGRVLPREEWSHAEATLAAAYGTGRRVSERVLGGPEDLAAYVEITPGQRPDHGHGHESGHEHGPFPEREGWLATMWTFVAGQLPPPPATVIEIGCGSKGGFVPELLAAGYDAVGVDPHAPAGPSYVTDRFEDVGTLAPADVVVASTSLHHVGDLGGVLDRIREVLRPGGTVVVVEWAWERFDERTATWCFERLPADPEDGGWLARHRERWSGSGQPWSAYLRGWAEGEGLHGGEAVVRALEERFERVLLAHGPYFFPDLAGTDERDEAAAIDAGLIEATCVRYVGRRD